MQVLLTILFTIILIISAIIKRKAQAEIIALVKVNPSEAIVKAVNESIIKNPCDIKIGIEYGDGLSKSSMFGGDW